MARSPRKSRAAEAADAVVTTPKNPFDDVGQPSEPAAVGELTLIEAPRFSSSSVFIAATGTEFIITLLRTVPALHKDGSMSSHAMNRPEAIVSMSPQSAKDLALALTKAVADHESKFGPLATPFTLRRDAENDKAGKKHH